MAPPLSVIKIVGKNILFINNIIVYCLSLLPSVLFEKLTATVVFYFTRCHLKGECSVFKKNVLWIKTIHYLNTKRSHLVKIVPMAPFTPKSTSKLRSALHIRYSKVIPLFISRANTAQT